MNNLFEKHVVMYVICCLSLVRWKLVTEQEMSYLLPHLHSGWAVDQAILAEEERLVVIRFGHDWDETCMQVFTSSIS